MTLRPVQSETSVDLSALSLSSLAHLCRKETDRFFKNLDYDDRYCFELFRRAILERDDISWDIILEQYSALVRSWIERHPSYPITDENKDFFVNRTFDNFWHAFNRDPNKLQKFSNVKSLLQYLKLCTNSAVREYADRRMHPQGVALSSTPVVSIAHPVDEIADFENTVAAKALWQYIEGLLKSEQERIVAQDFLIYDLKPREIYASHEDGFSGVPQVRRIKENLMARLRRDSYLAEIISNR
ncbi:MAG: hypothetical protein R3293_25585 [Candidatus Promineifilaceae bacterium]|nr:hypothetical protein [Candidatus Promineifilaceae bacterium]